ncbi:MAG: EamA family transporter [Alphaproteobacteria bacterium]|nr:EamA family transporter [Alphaproteobacteria bacterium]
MKILDVLFAIAVPIIWGLGFTLAKFVLAEFPPIMLIALRFSVTALALVWFVRMPRKLLPRIFLVSVVSATIQYSLTYTGLDGMDASTAGIVIQLEVPLAALIAAIFLKERLGWRRAVGMAMAFGGVAIMCGEPRIQENMLPVFFVMGGALTWAIGQVMVRALGQVGGFTLIAWVAVMAAPQLFLSSAAFESGQWEALRNATWVTWAAILYLGLIMNGIGYAMWYHLLGRYPVNQVMPYLLLVPVTTVATGVVLLGEDLTWIVALGGLVVVSGIAFITVDLERLLPARLRAARG